MSASGMTIKAGWSGWRALGRGGRAITQSMKEHKSAWLTILCVGILVALVIWAIRIVGLKTLLIALLIAIIIDVIVWILLQLL